MHIPDHVLDPSVSVTTCVAAAGVVAAAVAKTRQSAERPSLPVTAAVSGLVFALQMVNYPVASGVSGHVIGAALAVALLGPWYAILSITSVLLVQCLLFADGGITALGANIIIMAGVAVAVASGVRNLVSRTRINAHPVLAASMGAFMSVVVASATVSGFYAASSAASEPLVFARDLLGVHVIIGLGEAAFTALIIAVLSAIVPSLRGGGAWGSRVRPLPLAGGLTAAALGVGALLAYAAVAWPDGLESVAASHGVVEAPAILARTWLADYGASADIPLALVGVLGTLSSMALVGAVVTISGRRSAAVA